MGEKTQSKRKPRSRWMTRLDLKRVSQGRREMVQQSEKSDRPDGSQISVEEMNGFGLGGL